MNWKQLVASISLMLAAQGVAAEAADGATKSLICAATQVVGCAATGECVRATPETFNLPVLLKVDIANKVAESARAGGEKRVSAISAVTDVEGVSVLHGNDGTAGWSATIDQSSGQMTVVSARPGIAYTVFGNCATL